MQCPDCGKLRHKGECEYPPEQEQRQFWEEMELERARDLVRAAATRLEEGKRP